MQLDCKCFDARVQKSTIDIAPISIEAIYADTEIVALDKSTAAMGG